jgi:hypothetical protein
MMPCSNTAALRKYEAEQDRNDELMTIASAKRRQLVRDYINSQQYERDLRDYLADLAAEDGEFLHALQRGDVTRMQKLFEDAVDFRKGDELVAAEADLLAAEGK